MTYGSVHTIRTKSSVRLKVYCGSLALTYCRMTKEGPRKMYSGGKTVSVKYTASTTQCSVSKVKFPFALVSICFKL